MELAQRHINDCVHLKSLKLREIVTQLSSAYERHAYALLIIELDSSDQTRENRSRQLAVQLWFCRSGAYICGVGFE
jgi:hypothetical protein